MPELRYTKDHEFARVDGDVATVGISDYAQRQLGDVVFVELPKVGAALQAGQSVAVVESVKAASDVFSPISGKVVEVNSALEGEPALINEDPLGRGWLFKASLDDRPAFAELMDEAAYDAFLKTLG